MLMLPNAGVHELHAEPSFNIARIEMVYTRGVAYALPSTADTVNLIDMNVEVQR